MYQHTPTAASTLRSFPHLGRTDELPSTLRKVVGPGAYRLLRSSYGMAKHELQARDTGVPWRRKLAMWRRGFFAESAVIYDLPRNDLSDYVSDFDRSRWLREINGHNEIFAHKLVLRSFLLAMGFVQPETKAIVHNGRILLEPFSGNPRYVTPEQLGRLLLEDGGDFIVKPEDGSSGERLFVLRNEGGRLLVQRGREVEPIDFAAYVAALAATDGTRRMTLVERRLAQAPFWAGLFAGSANTIRVLTLWTPGEPAPFLARAVQRIGTADTVPTDNWSGGGISAPIDPASGRLGVGRMHPLKGRRPAHHFTHHPDSGAPIAGAELPGWAAIRATVLRAAASVPFNRMAGWDVLVTADATGAGTGAGAEAGAGAGAGAGTPVLLEANGNSDVNLLQVHGGLLADPAIRRFYQAVGVVRSGAA
jgi:Sugar-transfer associated ATP-grasp